jgi:hypothetical protein
MSPPSLPIDNVHVFDRAGARIAHGSSRLRKPSGCQITGGTSEVVLLADA